MNCLQIHKNRFAEFIENDFGNYIDQFKKLRTWDEGLDITAFSELFDVDIQANKYAASIVSNHKYIYPNSRLTVRLYFLNGDHYNLLQIKTLN